MLFCRSNTCKMWKIKFRMNFKNAAGITGVADADIGYSALSEGFVFNVKRVPSHSVTCALIPWQIRSAQSPWNIGTHTIYKQTVKVCVCQDWTSFYLLHGLWGWGERELIKKKHAILPSSFPLFIYFWDLKALRTHYSQGSFFILFSPVGKQLISAGEGQGDELLETKGISRDDRRDKGSLMGWRGQGAEELGGLGEKGAEQE